MHGLVMEIVTDADKCLLLEKIEYSTNPRKLITVGDMVKRHEERTRLEKRVKVVMGA